MIHLSVNVNKIATIRNSRGGNIPDLVEMCRIVIAAGAQGITVHPREDERHIRRNDVFILKDFLREHNSRSSQKKIEYNIEGELSPRFQDLVLEAEPDQVTLVPVSPGEITSDHGFDLNSDLAELQSYIPKFQKKGIRVSIFMEPDLSNLSTLSATGTNRVEFYTGPFAEEFSKNGGLESFRQYAEAANFVLSQKIEINAGHDLDTQNLKVFRNLPGLKEVSIGHRLISSALVYGLEDTVKQYLKTLAGDP